jgi:hypothetical protein
LVDEPDAAEVPEKQDFCPGALCLNFVKNFVSVASKQVGVQQQNICLPSVQHAERPENVFAFADNRDSLLLCQELAQFSPRHIVANDDE